jgi:hypothetical protein
MIHIAEKEEGDQKNGVPKKILSFKQRGKTWESVAPLSPEQLHYTVRQYLRTAGDAAAIDTFVDGKRNTLNRYVQRVLKQNRFSVRKISISQSVPVDWRKKAEDNAARVREKL